MFPMSELVERFLDKNEDLRTFLDQFFQRLKGDVRAPYLELEHYVDVEEHWEKLFVLIGTSIVDEAEIEAFEEEIFNTLFVPNSELLDGRVVLSVQ